MTTIPQDKIGPEPKLRANGMRASEELRRPLDPFAKEKVLAIVRIRAAAQVFTTQHNRYTFGNLKAAVARLAELTGW